MADGVRKITRRSLIKAGAVAVAGYTGMHRGALAVGDRTEVPTTAPASARSASKPVARPDLLDEAVRDRLECAQLTTDPQVGGSHIYMEAQIFTPDSKRFVFQRSGHAHGSDRNDPNHQFMLCDLDDNLAMMPLTDELGTTGPAVSPDGKYLYYFVDESMRPGGNRVMLRRVNLDGTDRQTLFVIDHRLPGTSFQPSNLYPLSTISSDGKRLAISARLSNQPAAGPLPYGLLVFDLEKATFDLVLHGPSWANMHPQYCRSTDPPQMNDILVQENHHRLLDAKGDYVKPADRAGADIHVIRDDGTNFRDLPWGRDGKELCQGHQCWRGQSDWAITSTQIVRSLRAELIESRPVAPAGHVGLQRTDGVRNMLSRDFTDPQFHHFATDRAGKRFITDAEPFSPAGRVMLARLGEPGRDALKDWTCLARPKPTGDKLTHMHPFLSPDGNTAFFNSDESGRLQAYMIRGLDNL